MDIILYLLQLIQYQHKQICWLLNFICRYIPLKQWAFDDSHSPKYQKFKIDDLSLITNFRQDWTYKELIPYYEKRYGKKIRPISRRSECNIPDSCTCPRCDAPKPFLYKNNGSKGQLLCKICDARFSPDESRFASVKLRCPHCGNTLVPKKDRKHFIVHKCVNPKYSYYLHTLKKVDKADLKEDYGKNKYKLHYIYREFTIDFFSMDLNTLPKNASSLKFSKHNAHVMSLCLTLHVNLGLSLRKTSQALKDLYNISISHQQIANYCKTAAICIKPLVDQYPYEKNEVFTADETYIKIRGIKTYVWLIMNAATRSILGYQVSDNRGVGIIPLNDKIIPLVKNRYDPNKKYLINNKFGNHYTYGTYMNGNFNTCMGKLKMKHLPHDGIHTFASLMDSVGANDVCIKLIMGHSMKNDTTKGTYTHKTLEELLAEVNKI